MTRRGFTLLEVLVSLAIFALAAVVLGAAYVNVLTSYAAVAHRQEHEQDLRLVHQLVLDEPERAQVEKGGTLPLPNGRAARWTAQVAAMPVADLFRVGFSCEIDEQAGRPAWRKEETFLLLRPTWSDPAERDRLREVSRRKLARNER